MIRESREQRRERIVRERQSRFDRRRAVAATVVPVGSYCYSRVPDQAGDAERAATGEPFIPGRNLPCPYYKLRKDKPAQRNGYCRLLRRGDWEPYEKGGTLSLWDGCKECGINELDDDSGEPGTDGSVGNASRAAPGLLDRTLS
ncbi:hypothetical protein [Sphingomonas sp. 3-13AW]|uniref:hypothetical protein n=1 Tax=Sphingomonas sp. 3-13AW TaxID=3050450 RepID=UPI003BB7E25B